MSSSFSTSQQQNTPITNETHRDYKEMNLPEPDLRTINNNDFNIQNNTSESLERYNVNDDTEKIKVNNECKMYENGTKYPLLTLEDALVDSTALSLKEFDKILDIYHKRNNISDTIEPISLDDLDLIINNAESNVLNIEEEKNIILDKHNLRDADILNINLYNNTNSKADDQIEIFVENKTEPEFIDKSNITLYNSSNIRKIDTDVDEPAIPATATNTILSNSKIESKFEVNKPTTFIKVIDNFSSNIESCIDSKHNLAFNVIDKEKTINDSILINSKAINFNIDKNEINDNINTSNETLAPNENSQYRGILLEHKDNGKNYFKESPKNNLTVIEVLSSDDEDSNNISKNVDTSDIIYTVSNQREEKSLDENDSHCSGYHSSDFEFIDEEEAKKFGYYSSNKFETNEQNFDDFIINDYFDTLFPKDEQNNDRDNHVIPEGDNFVNLFNNQNYIRMFDYHVESKSVTTGVSMNTNYESIGFDMRYRENRPELEACKLLINAINCYC